MPVVHEVRARAFLYLTKARQHLQAAGESLANGRWDSAALLSVHAGINAADAACIERAEVRAGGRSHADAAKLIRQLFTGDEAAANASDQLAWLVDRKHTIEYEARRAAAADAEAAYTRAERVLRWAEAVLATA